MQIKNKQYGVSLVEILVVLTIFIIAIGYGFSVWNNSQISQERSSIASRLAAQHYEFAEALESYITSNSYGDLSNSVITVQELMDNGFLSSIDRNGEPRDGKDALGLEIIGLVASPFGFPQSVAVVQRGDIDPQLVNRLDLDSDTILESIIRRASSGVASLSSGMYSGVAKSEGNTKNVMFQFSEEKTDLSEYFSERELGEFNDISLASFITMNIQPGYWVLRYKLYYPTLVFDRSIGNSFQELTSLGYSRNCPEGGFEVAAGYQPNFLPGPNGIDDVIIDDRNPGYGEVMGNSQRIGDLSNFQYLCLPSSEIITPRNQERRISISEGQRVVTQDDLSCSVGGTGFNSREYSIINANNFIIDEAEYSFILKGSFYNTDCQFGEGTHKLYYVGQVFDKHLPDRINIFENDEFRNYIQNVEVRDIILR